MDVAPAPTHFPAKLLHLLTDALYPPRCALCGAAGFDRMDICAPCYRDLPWLTSSCEICALPFAHAAQQQTRCGRCQQKPPHFDHGISLFRYETGAMQLVQQLKFRQRLALSRLLGGMLLQKIVEQRADMPGCIVPVPLSRKRLCQRGFNQSLELARPLANALAIPVDVSTVIRARDTRPQTGLDRDLRRKNIKGAFEIVSTPAQEHVAIVDDVITTGSTVNELARVLKRAGVKRVDVWSIARAV